MSEKVGHSVLPIARPSGAWTKKTRTPIDAPLVTSGTPNNHEVRFLILLHVIVETYVVIVVQIIATF